MKRTFRLILCLIVCAALLCGCSGSADSGAQDAGTLAARAEAAWNALNSTDEPIAYEYRNETAADGESSVVMTYRVYYAPQAQQFYSCATRADDPAYRLESLICGGESWVRSSVAGGGWAGMGPAQIQSLPGLGTVGQGIDLDADLSVYESVVQEGDVIRFTFGQTYFDLLQKNNQELADQQVELMLSQLPEELHEQMRPVLEQQAEALRSTQWQSWVAEYTLEDAALLGYSSEMVTQNLVNGEARTTTTREAITVLPDADPAAELEQLAAEVLS